MTAKSEPLLVLKRLANPSDANKMRAVLLSLAFVILFPASALSTEPAPFPGSFEVPLLFADQSRSVRIPMRSDWFIHENRRLSSGAILLRVADSKTSFRFLVTVFPEGGTRDESELRKRTARALMPELRKELETGRSLDSLYGRQIRGFMLRGTDPRWTKQDPPEGEYRYAVQGTGSLGSHAIVFTILANESPSVHVQAALDALREAESKTSEFNLRLKRLEGALSSDEQDDRELQDELLGEILRDATAEELYLLGEWFAGLGNAEAYQDLAIEQYEKAAREGHIPSLNRLVESRLSAPASPSVR